jgi:hypothetical protein
VRHLPELVPFHAWDRVEIDAQLVRVIEIVGAHRVRVQLEAGEVGIHASVAASRGTTSSAVRPDGKLSDTTSTQSGRDPGARFW